MKSDVGRISRRARVRPDIAVSGQLPESLSDVLRRQRVAVLLDSCPVNRVGRQWLSVVSSKDSDQNVSFGLSAMRPWGRSSPAIGREDELPAS